MNNTNGEGPYTGGRRAPRETRAEKDKSLKLNKVRDGSDHDLFLETWAIFVRTPPETLSREPVHNRGAGDRDEQGIRKCVQILDTTCSRNGCDNGDLEKFYW